MQGNRTVHGKNNPSVRSVGNNLQKQPPATTTTKTGTAIPIKKSDIKDQKKPQGGLLQGCLGCLGVLTALAIVISVVFAILGNEDSETVTAPLSSINPGKVVTNTSEMDGQVRSMITNAIGTKTNNDETKIIGLQINDHSGTQKEGDKIVVAKLQGNDNLSDNMIMGGMQLESIKVFKELFKLDNIEEVALIWQFPTTDPKGNSSINTVLKITLIKATASKINWSSFDRKNFENVADSYWEHPSIRNK